MGCNKRQSRAAMTIGGTQQLVQVFPFAGDPDYIVEREVHGGVRVHDLLSVVFDADDHEAQFAEIGFENRLPYEG